MNEKREMFFWTEADKIVDPRLEGNYRKGARFEAFIFLILDNFVKTLPSQIQNRIRILHNPFTFRKYTSRKGRGIDILIYYRKWTGHWIQLFAIECKHWTPRFMSPKVFRTHVLKRFSNIIQPIKILISKGIKYSTQTERLLNNNSILKITNNFTSNIKKLIQTQINKLIKNKLMTNITNKSDINISKSVYIHMSRKYAITQGCQTNNHQFNSDKKHHFHSTIAKI